MLTEELRFSVDEISFGNPDFVLIEEEPQDTRHDMDIQNEKEHHLGNFEEGFGFLSRVQVCNNLVNSSNSLHFQETKEFQGCVEPGQTFIVFINQD